MKNDMKDMKKDKMKTTKKIDRFLENLGIAFVEYFPNVINCVNVLDIPINMGFEDF